MLTSKGVKNGFLFFWGYVIIKKQGAAALWNSKRSFSEIFKEIFQIRLLALSDSKNMYSHSTLFEFFLKRFHIRK